MMGSPVADLKVRANELPIAFGCSNATNCFGYLQL